MTQGPAHRADRDRRDDGRPRPRLPAGDHRHLPGRLPRQGRRLARSSVDGKVVGSKPDRPGIQGPRPTSSPAPRRPDTRGNVTFFGNLGPNSIEAREEVRENLAAYLRAARSPTTNRPDRATDVPVDAVTQSASGVDPHISQANARIQAHRIAAVRKLPLDQVEDLISDHTDGRFLGLLGEPGVNVLELNLALDRGGTAQMTTETQARSLLRSRDPPARRCSSRCASSTRASRSATRSCSWSRSAP